MAEQTPLAPPSLAEIMRSPEFQALTPQQQKEAPQRYVDTFGKSVAARAAEHYGLDPDVFARQIQQESNWKNAARSPAGAQGVSQFVPATALEQGVDPSDPDLSMYGQAKYMRSLIDQLGSKRKALAAYNAGIGTVKAAINKYGEFDWERGIPPETRDYLARITSAGQSAPSAPVSTTPPPFSEIIKSPEFAALSPQEQAEAPYRYAKTFGGVVPKEFMPPAPAPDLFPQQLPTGETGALLGAFGAPLPVLSQPTAPPVVPPVTGASLPPATPAPVTSPPLVSPDTQWRIPGQIPEIKKSAPEGMGIPLLSQLERAYEKTFGGPPSPLGMEPLPPMGTQPGETPPPSEPNPGVGDILALSMIPALATHPMGIVGGMAAAKALTPLTEVAGTMTGGALGGPAGAARGKAIGEQAGQLGGFALGVKAVGEPLSASSILGRPLSLGEREYLGLKKDLGLPNDAPVDAVASNLRSTLKNIRKNAPANDPQNQALTRWTDGQELTPQDIAALGPEAQELYSKWLEVKNLTPQETSAIDKAYRKLRPAGPQPPTLPPPAKGAPLEQPAPQTEQAAPKTEQPPVQPEQAPSPAPKYGEGRIPPGMARLYESDFPNLAASLPKKYSLTTVTVNGKKIRYVDVPEDSPFLRDVNAAQSTSPVSTQSPPPIVAQPPQVKLAAPPAGSLEERALQYAQGLGRVPTISEIRKELGISIKQASPLRKMIEEVGIQPKAKQEAPVTPPVTPPTAPEPILSPATKEEAPTEAHPNLNKTIEPGNEYTLRPTDIHTIAQRHGIESDAEKNPAFGEWTKQLTGESHLDKMQPAQLRTVAEALARGKKPPIQVPTAPEKPIAPLETEAPKFESPKVDEPPKVVEAGPAPQEAPAPTPEQQTEEPAPSQEQLPHQTALSSAKEESSLPQSTKKITEGETQLPSNAPEGPSLLPQGAGSLNFPVHPVLPQPIHGNVAPFQGMRDSTLTDADRLREFSNSPAFREHGLGGFDIPSQRMMMSVVIRALHDPQIFNSVVQSVPVNVMNVLRGIKSSSQVSLHDQAVLGDPLVFDPKNSISLRSDIADTTIRKMAGQTTESMVPSPSDLGRPPQKLSPTEKTDTSDQGHVAPPTSNVSGAPSSELGAPLTIPQSSSQSQEPPPQETPSGFLMGHPHPVTTEAGTKFDTRLAVAEAPDLVTSHDDNYRANPDYPQELQPRNRDQQSLRLQVEEIGNKPDTARLGDTPTPSPGAPIVGPDKTVESGNGRTMGLRKAYARGTAGDYKQWLVDNAPRWGLDPQAIQNMKAPVLVRVRQTEVPNRVKFAQEANNPGVAGMSPKEIAFMDAKNMSPELVRQFVPAEDGNLNSAQNAGFINQFFTDLVPKNEWPNYYMEDGSGLNTTGIQRVRNAIIAKAYGNPEMVTRIGEDPDANVKAIMNALVVTAPRFVKLQERIDAGARYPLNIASDLATAANTLSSLRAKGINVNNYLNNPQGALFGAPKATPFEKDVLDTLEKYARSGKKLGSLITRYLDAVETTGDPRQHELFGPKGPTPSKADLWSAALTYEGETGGGQTSLFSDEPASTTEGTPGAVPTAPEPTPPSSPSTQGEPPSPETGPEGEVPEPTTPGESPAEEPPAPVAAPASSRAAVTDLSDDDFENALQEAQPPAPPATPRPPRASRPQGASVPPRAPRAPRTPKVQATPEEQARQSLVNKGIDPTPARVARELQLLQEFGSLKEENAPYGAPAPPPVPDEARYERVKPLLLETLDDFAQMGRPLTDFFRDAITTYGQNAVPYLRRLRHDLQQEKQNVPHRGPSPEPDRPNGPPETPGAPSPVLNEPGGTQPNITGTGQGATGTGPLVAGDRGVPDTSPAAGGTSGNQRVYTPDGQLDLEKSATGDNEPSGSSGGGEAGSPTDEQRTADIVDDVQELGTATEGERLARQQDFNALPDADKRPTFGDARDIARTVPYLLPEQQNDVLKAEQRFFDADGKVKEHGMLFTNGPGTGKTFTGLGIAYRQFLAGKKNILVLAPTQELVETWATRAALVGLPLRPLTSTTENGGSGPVVTTYANMHQNISLVAPRTWDLIILDESHSMSSEKTGAVNETLRMFRALTGHHVAFLDWARTAYPREYERYDRVAQAMRHVSQDATDQEIMAMEREIQEAGDAVHAIEKRERPLYQKRWQEGDRPLVTFLSATPFAWAPNVDAAEGFLFHYVPPSRIFQEGLRGGSGYNAPDKQQAFMIQHFGYRMRTGKLTQPTADVNSEIMEQNFNQWLQDQGALVGRQLDVPFDYDRRFVLTPSAIGQDIDRGLDILRNGSGGVFDPLYRVAEQNFDFHKRQFLLEAIKAKEAIPQIQAHLDLGRKVVVFHDFNKGGGFHPFKFEKKDYVNEAQTIPVKQSNGTYKTETWYTHDLIDKFNREHTDLANLDFSDLEAPIDTLKKAFPEAVFFNGTVPKKKRSQAIDQFNSEQPGADPHRIIVVQSDAGREGISLHDTTGKYQRVNINLGMPSRPVATIQIEGRIYRIGQASNAIQRYMTTGTSWETRAFATSIAQRASTAENLGMGVLARGLRQSFIDAYGGAEHFTPYEGEGTGGKEYDKSVAAQQTLTGFAKAKTYYWAQQKLNARRDQRAGQDYFPTPEPIGFKMVEFADIRKGNHVLEPSAGHGAIGRFIPEDTTTKLIEPSAELANRARLANNKATVIEDTFENHHVSNKYQAILMNPPYGSGGKTAFEHLIKAAGHLAEGGRIVAILPRGGMADRRWEQFQELDSKEPGGNVYPIATINLPSVTFERAGTGVNTRLVVLQKASTPEAVRQIPDGPHLDLSDAKTINELFDRIEHINMPSRQENLADQLTSRGATLPPQGEPAGPKPLTTQTEHLDTRINKTVQKVNIRPTLSSDQYAKVAGFAKANSGGWSRFAKGFLFPTAEKAMAFRVATENHLKIEGVSEPTAEYGPDQVQSSYEQIALFPEPKTRADAKVHAEQLTQQLIPSAEDLSTAGGTLGRDRGTPDVITTAQAIRTDLEEKGFITLHGQELRTAQDLATIARVYRNKQYETFHIVYAQEGKVVDHEAFTSRLPGTVQVIPKGQESAFIQNIKDRILKIEDNGNGNVKWWLSHNHPGGNPAPSGDDRRFSSVVPALLDREGGGGRYAGHVIINFDTYAYIDPKGKSTHYALDRSVTGTEDPLEPNQAPIPHEVLGKMVLGSGSVALVGKELQAPTGWVAIVYRDATGRVRAAQSIHEQTFLDTEKAKAHLKAGLLRFGAAEAFAYVEQPSVATGTDKMYAAATKLIRSGALMDYVTPEISFNPSQQVKRADIFADENGEIPTFRVAAPKASYLPGMAPPVPPSPSKLGRWLTFKKHSARDGRNLRDISETNEGQKPLPLSNSATRGCRSRRTTLPRPSNSGCMTSRTTRLLTVSPRFLFSLSI